MNNNELTIEEKIDYIFLTLKKQESRAMRATVFKWGFRIFILLYLYYFITVGLPAMIGSMIPQIPNLSGTGGLNAESIKNAFNNLLQ